MEQRDGIRQLKGGGNLQVRWDCNRCQSFLPISGLDVLAAIRQNEKLDGIPTAVVTSPAARRIIVKSKKAELTGLSPSPTIWRAI